MNRRDESSATLERLNPHRLYRNRDDRILCGVCSGIADYFGLDRRATRLVTLIVAIPLYFRNAKRDRYPARFRPEAVQKGFCSLRAGVGYAVYNAPDTGHFMRQSWPSMPIFYAEPVSRMERWQSTG